ncbi:hypothetical protein K402DRAFT_398875 [Aulographum hederae CBS 113979]|uniref:Uncharacterized protein n=1 Tax=Aulographum hederae CBS 113979 TaxID=1176131 RepID=A0A6G1GJL8_9PEZI|nr:hypothetical protein K402DRAFT_398875 [Aulographum hederae CBS 113979]
MPGSSSSTPAIPADDSCPPEHSGTTSGTQGGSSSSSSSRGSSRSGSGSGSKKAPNKNRFKGPLPYADHQGGGFWKH